MFEFILNTKTKIGERTALKLPDYLAELNLTHPGIIIDKNVAQVNYIHEVTQNLKHALPKHIVWEYDILGEPDYDSLDNVKKLFHKRGKVRVDCFVAIGGGSVIDIAKGLATLATNPGPARKYRGFPAKIKPSLPTIALPTVAGTGSEVTYNASFIDWREKRKMGINTFFNFPRLSVLDPLLTLDCPLSVSVSSAMDSMVHALESYATPKANTLSKIFSAEAFLFTYHALPKLLKKPKDIQARLDLQFGAYLAGIAIVQVGGGPASILSYPLGVHGRVPHGLAGAVTLPYIIEHNVKAGVDYSRLYDRMANTNHSLSIQQKNKDFAKKLFALDALLNIPSMFSRYTLVKEHKQIIMEEIKGLTNGFTATNPVSFSVNDAKNIINKLLTLSV